MCIDDNDSGGDTEWEWMGGSDRPASAAREIGGLRGDALGFIPLPLLHLLCTPLASIHSHHVAVDSWILTSTPDRRRAAPLHSIHIAASSRIAHPPLIRSSANAAAIIAMDDDITDEEMMALAAATSARSTTQAAPAWSSASNAAAAAATAAPRSFQSAFASMTTSSHYTSVANMPLPPPSTAAASGSAAAAAMSSAVRPARPGGSGLVPVPKAQSAHAILVSPRQRGNPVLTHISNVAWELGPRDMSADYVLGETCAALYLSLKYHLLHGHYVASRMSACGSSFTLRVLLLLVDVDDSERPLLDLSKLCFAHGWTLVCCWSSEETARYLETLKAYEKKTSAAIEERVDHADHAATLLDALTQVRSINKTDVRHLLTNFGSFAALAQASKEELTAVPGMGERKVHRLHHVFNQPFITSQMRLRTDVTSSITTPAQAAAAHAAAMAKAAAAAAAPAKRTPIVYLNQMPTTSAPAAALVAPVHATPAVATLPALPAVSAAAVSSLAAVAAAAAPAAGRPPLPSPAAAAAVAPPTTAPVPSVARPLTVAPATSADPDEMSDFSDFVTR